MDAVARTVVIGRGGARELVGDALGLVVSLSIADTLAPCVPR
jgi:hypothetical protein